MALVIDLGYRTGTDDEPSVSGPWDPNRRRAVRLGLLVVGVLALVAASGTAIVGDPMPLVASVQIGDAAHLMVQGGRAFILDAHNDTSEISAYAIPGGQPLWSVPIAGQALNGTFLISGSTIVVDAPAAGASDHAVQGFDLTTGRLLWTLASDGVTATPNGLISSARVEQGVSADAGYRVQGIDPRTGRRRWTVQAASDCAMTVSNGRDAASSTMIEYCFPSGHLTVFNIETGAVRAERLAAAPTYDGQALPIIVIGNVIIVSQQQDPGLYATAYRVGDLAPLWSGLPDPIDVALSPCAPNLCMAGRAGLTTLDPRTGRTIATTIPTVPAVRIRLHPGVLDLVVVAPLEIAAVDRIDPGVSFVPDLPPATSVDVPEFKDAHVFTTWITEQGLDGTLRPVASLHGVGESCVFESLYAACTTAADRLSFYRLP